MEENKEVVEEVKDNGTNPLISNSESVIKGSCYRITVLTEM